MNKILLQFLLLVALFFSSWFLISRINFMKIFKIEEKINVNEKKLGDLLWDAYKNNEVIIEDETLTDSINSFKERICNTNNILADSIHVYIIQKDEVNAFALPNNRIVIYTGLIKACKNPEELSSVMAHELAHIQKKHVMKKLAKEVGIAVLATLAGGSNGAGIIKEILKTLSSTAYDRTLEREADETGADYLCKAGISPTHMADFFFRLAKEDKMPEVLDWISTHPDSKDRAAEILKKEKTMSCKTKAMMSNDQWTSLQDRVKSTSEIIQEATED